MSLYQKEIKVILEVLEKAGILLKDYFYTKNYQISFKQANEPATQADTECNDLIIRTIQHYFTNDLILSEETSEYHNIKNYSMKINSCRMWIIDPIDGTQEFIKGIPEFAISIGLVENNEPLLGFIYNPVKNFLLYGGPKIGLYHNHKELSYQPRKISSTQDMRICVSRSEMKKKLLGDLTRPTLFKDVVVVGSIAYKLGLVVTQEFDAVVSLRPKNIWDIAGGVCLIHTMKQYVVLDQCGQPIPLNHNGPLPNGVMAGHATTIQLITNIMQ